MNNKIKQKINKHADSLTMRIVLTIGVLVGLIVSIPFVIVGYPIVLSWNIATTLLDFRSDEETVKSTFDFFNKWGHFDDNFNSWKKETN
jgi:hypothetical protein